ncbi:MAG: hypothetical protein LW854_17050 [Rubrivivax sp.]|jgi:hypothetical protein|nr:hypothetical protein [Rubrivivax sp.]
MKKLWTRLLGHHSWIRRFGTFREREQAGVLNRPNYAYGMLRAADTAKYFGHSEVTVCEFGVATGYGLTAMTELAELITAETGVKFRIYGFDTGAGLPPPNGHADHPELWNPGDFSMGDVDGLRKRLSGKAELIIGDINDTIDGFTNKLTEKAPLGFVSIDVDIYSGTVSSLRALHNVKPQVYLPAVSFYFDDVNSYFNNFACGELKAIHEHNAARPLRPIDQDRSLPGRRLDAAQAWYANMYVCHLLDHPTRNVPRKREAVSLEDHMKLAANL